MKNTRMKKIAITNKRRSHKWTALILPLFCVALATILKESEGSGRGLLHYASPTRVPRLDYWVQRYELFCNSQNINLPFSNIYMKFNFFPLNFLKSIRYSTTMKTLSLSFRNKEIAEDEQRISIGFNLKSPKHSGKFWIYWNNMYFCIHKKQIRLL